MKTDVLDIRGQKTGEVDLPAEIFGAEVAEDLIAQAVRVYLANQRQGTVSTKRRSEVIGSRRKIWRQKGTGRARHADRYAPIFVGGGLAHGPKPRNWSLKMPQKMRRKALFGALTSQFKKGKMIVVQGLEKVEPETKKLLETLASLKIKVKQQKLGEKILLILPGKGEKILRAGKNLTNLSLAQANLLHPYQILNCDKLVFLKSSLEVVEKTFLRPKKSEKGLTAN